MKAETKKKLKTAEKICDIGAVTFGLLGAIFIGYSAFKKDKK